MRVAKKLLAEKFASDTLENLEKRCKLIQDATITEYVVKDKIQATQIFAFQNDRGKKLSKLEIIKAYFMLQIYLSGTSKEKVEDDIRYIEDELTKIYKQIVRINIGEDEVLNYYWRAESGHGYNSEEVVKGIKDAVSSLTSPKSDWIKSFLSGLSQAFQTVEKIEKSNDSVTRDLLYLNNMALAYPFLIKAYKMQADEKTISRLTKLLENITFRYLIRGGRAEIETRLNQHLIHMNTVNSIEKNIDDIIANIKSNGWWNYWNDNTLYAHLNSKYFYGNRVDNYLLWKYELHIGSNNYPKPLKVTYANLISQESIEHIAPQTPTNGDPVAYGYGLYDNVENPDEGIVSGNWMNCLGNLMLISKKHNSSIGNKPFKDKLDSYGRDNLLNQQKQIMYFLSDSASPVWDKEAIEKRQKAIVEAAKVIWGLDRV